MERGRKRITPNAFTKNIDGRTTVVDFKIRAEKVLGDMRKNAYQFLDQKTKDYVEKVHEKYLSDDTNLEYTPALLHSDLSPEHVIYDEDKKAGVSLYGLRKKVFRNFLTVFPAGQRQQTYEKVRFFQ